MKKETGHNKKAPQAPKKADLIARAQVDRLGRPPMDMLEREIARLERSERYIKLAVIASAGLAAVVGAAILAISMAWITIMQVSLSGENPTLQNGDVVLAVKSDDPPDGSIIAFRFNDGTYIGQVVAAAGDIIEIDDAGYVLINGGRLTEPHELYQTRLGGQNPDNNKTAFPYEVEEGKVLILAGDRLALVLRSQLAGRVSVKLWPRFGRIL